MLDYPGFRASWCRAVIAEQYYLAVAEQYYNKNIKTLYSSIFPTGDEVSKIKFTHLMGSKIHQEVLAKLDVIKQLIKT